MTTKKPGLSNFLNQFFKLCFSYPLKASEIEETWRYSRSPYFWRTITNG